MSPVARGYCKMTDLLDGSLTMWDIALANDHIAVMAENQRRANEKR